MEKALWKEKLAFYDKLIEACPDFERKGKSMPYTSVNGHMFSQLNKAGEIGIRLSREAQKKFIEAHQAGEFRSYGAVMKDYVRVPEALWDDFELLVSYLNAGYRYAKSLEPK